MEWVPGFGASASCRWRPTTRRHFFRYKRQSVGVLRRRYESGLSPEARGTADDRQRYRRFLCEFTHLHDRHLRQNRWCAGWILCSVRGSARHSNWWKAARRSFGRSKRYCDRQTCILGTVAWLTCRVSSDSFRYWENGADPVDELMRWRGLATIAPRGRPSACAGQRSRSDRDRAPSSAR